jgi:non-ribosomal peptide synthetase component E (peptide arylation enzyme)
MTLQAIQDHLLGLGFAKFKLPERIEDYEQLPRNALGKVQRFVLQEVISAKVTSESDS